MSTDQGLDAETLGLMLDGLKEYLDDALPLERQLELDHEDICPEDTVRAMSDRPGHPAGLRPRGVRRHGRWGLRLLPALRGHGPQGHRPGHRDLRHLPGQRPDPGRRHRGAEAEVARRDRRGRHRLRLRRHRARGGVRPRRHEDQGRPDRGRRRDHRLPHQRRQAVDLQRHHRRLPPRSWPWPPAARRGSSSRRALPASPAPSPRTSTASGCRTPRPCSWTTSRSRSRTSSAASRARASCRPSRSSATPA